MRLAPSHRPLPPRPFALLSLALFTLVLAACGATGPAATPRDPVLAISGTVRTAEAQSVHALAAAALPAGAAHADGHDDVIAGEILVVFRGDDAVTRAAVSARGATLTAARPLSIEGGLLMRAAGADAVETVALAAEIARRPDVLAASPNRVVRTFAQPNDALYGRMWNLDAIRMPAAWDVTTGSSSVVVAVVDTGVRGRPGTTSATHPDLRGKLLPGYDFVDGDADPFDPGTFASNQTHGTHVAATIAARTNDAVGIAGIDWAAMLVPVRVLDEGGSGSMADVLDGVRWAAGLGAPGVPSNENPADVINLSLGGGGACSSVEQLVFDQVAASGAVVVVAAGNSKSDARATTPASCANVIAVGATDRDDRRSHYSNHGPAVALMAPGGDLGAIGPDGSPNGILSAVHDGEATWGYLQGTSMAAPHVSGVAALMRALDPDITPARVLALLRATAAPMSTSDCEGREPLGLKAQDCGAGLLDARGALLALDAPEPPSPPPPPPPPAEPEDPEDPAPIVTFDPGRLDFGADAESATLTLRNTGTRAADWALVGYGAAVSNPGGVGIGVLSVDATGGTLAAGASRSLTFTIDRDAAPRDGSYRLDLLFEIGGADRTVIPLHFDQEGHEAESPSLSGTRLLACIPTSDGCDPQRSTDVVVRGGTSGTASYVLGGLEDTAYVVIGWRDVNGSGRVDKGDLFGFHSRHGVGATSVTPPASAVDLTLRTVTDQAAAGAAPDEARDLLHGWLDAR